MSLRGQLRPKQGGLKTSGKVTCKSMGGGVLARGEARAVIEKDKLARLKKGHYAVKESRRQTAIIFLYRCQAWGRGPESVNAERFGKPLIP